MISIRPSAAVEPSPHLTEFPRPEGQTNSEWFSRALPAGEAAGAIVLLGGVSLTDFRLRVAQSHARNDLLPSYWSHAALIRQASGERNWELHEVSLEPPGGFGAVPANNGVQQANFSAYDEPSRFPNIACLQVRVRPDALRQGLALAQALEAAVNTFRRQRSVVDLGSMLVEWLGFVWGVGEKGNPLFKSMGVPSAVFIESVFAMTGVELTPGLAGQSSCPEAIWQAAKWWHEFYESEATLTESPLTGRYFIGQPAAAVVEPPPPVAPLPQRRQGTRSGRR